MRVPNHGSVFVAMLWICTILLATNGEGVFQLRLERFINDEGVDATGQCCTSFDRNQNTCNKPCYTAFRVCLTHYQANVDPDQPCTYGRLETPVIGQNSFLPMDNQFFENDPIQFKIESRWLASFSLIVDVVHKNANFSNQLGHDTDSSDSLISRLVVKSGLQLPVKDKVELWTTPPPYRHRNSELHYSYRVMCLRNSYGPGCAIYCQPQNDSLGHFDCNEDGLKVCLPGWTKSENDAYCTKATCREGCLHGTCNRPNVCKCHIGWTGKDCSQCMTQPGCVHGTCSRPYQCKCLDGWGGRLCNQDLNYCTNNHPCRNGGSCSNTGEGTYTCSCASGFIGRDCQLEVNECDSQPCKNGAKCVDLISDYHCECTANFFGRNCDDTRITCANSPCQNKGRCIEGDKHFHCECPIEWTGFSCEKPTSLCTASLCQNGGTCISTSNEIECSCKSGFSGKLCETVVSHCQGSLCLNGGVCADPLVSRRKCHCRRCVCLSPFGGSKCQRNLTAIAASKPSSRVNLQRDIVQSGKYETTKTETRVVISNNEDASLDTKHWIAICFGSGILVLLLALSAGCLIYHRKKLSLAKLQLKLSQTAAHPQRSIEMTLPIVVDHSIEDVLKVDQRMLPHHFKQKVCSSAMDFHKQKSCEDLTISNKNHHFEMQPSGKNGVVTNDRITRRHSSQFTRPNAMFEFTSEAKEVTPTTNQNYDLSSQQMISGHQDTMFSEGSRFLEHKRVENRHSLSRLPTYEEVCEENDVLLKQCPVSTKSIVI